MKHSVCFAAILAMGCSFMMGCRGRTGGISPPMASSSHTRAMASRSLRKAAPDFSLRDLKGKRVHLSDFKGKVVVMDFWATWCPPCREEIPHLIEFAHRYKAKGVALIGISVDEDGLKAVKLFVEKYKIDYPVLLADEQVQSDFGPIEGIPTKVILDRNGNIAARLIGYQEISTIEKKVKPFL